MKKENWGVCIAIMAVLFELGSIYWWTQIPDMGDASGYAYEPAYHFSILFSKISLLLLLIGLIIYLKFIWPKLKVSEIPQMQTWNIKRKLMYNGK